MNFNRYLLIEHFCYESLTVIHELYSIKCICDQKMLSFKSMYIEQRVSIERVSIRNDQVSATLSLSGTVGIKCFRFTSICIVPAMVLAN